MDAVRRRLIVVVLVGSYEPLLLAVIVDVIIVVALQLVRSTATDRIARARPRTREIDGYSFRAQVFACVFARLVGSSKSSKALCVALELADEAKLDLCRALRAHPLGLEAAIARALRSESATDFERI